MTRELAVRDNIPALSIGPFEATPVGLVISGDEVPYDVWEAYGGALRRVEGAIHWVIGDWLNYGKMTYGEKHTQAISDTGFDYQTLNADKWVAKQIEFMRRRINLSWSHHREVASLEPDKQGFWLEKAEEEDLSARQLRKEIRQWKRRQKDVEGLALLPLQIKDRFSLFCGDFENDDFSIEPGSIDAIITDPPYKEEYLHLYGVLAEKAAWMLKPGGSLLAMTGQSYLPEIINLMIPHIRYNWTVAYLTPGGQSPQLWQRKVNTFWKPVLWFVRGDYQGAWIGDVAKSIVNDNDKRFHDWGQSESGMADLVERFTYSGDLILDPFCGGGTTGVVAITRNRRFIGIDIDDQEMQIATRRINEQCQMLDQNGQDGVISD